MKLVIVQSSETELKRSAELFAAFGCDVLATGRTGEDALELTRRFKPDALIMDAILPYYNGDEVVEILEQELCAPIVKVAISEEHNERLAERFLNNGGDLFLMLPMDYAYTVRRIEKYHALRMRQIAINGPMSMLRNCTRKFQMRMKMPIAINGFLYIQDAVEIACEKPLVLQKVVADLYPEIAARYHVPPGCVERCIRTAVEQTFERGDMDFLYPHFGHAIRANTGKPTNSEFIAILAEMVRENLKYVI